LLIRYDELRGAYLIAKTVHCLLVMYDGGVEFQDFRNSAGAVQVARVVDFLYVLHVVIGVTNKLREVVEAGVEQLFRALLCLAFKLTVRHDTCDYKGDTYQQ
jgi:hypothetical protein